MVSSLNSVFDLVVINAQYLSTFAHHKLQHSSLWVIVVYKENIVR